MNKTELALNIYQTAHLTGTFRLRSGQISHEYFDKYRFESNPQLLAQIAIHMKTLLPHEVEVLAGLEMGGIPVATAIGLLSHHPIAFVRKKAKDYGTCKLAEGCEIKGKNVCLIEDVITTGGQVIESAMELRRLGAKVDQVLCVILRSESGLPQLRENGLEVTALLTRADLDLAAQLSLT
ncbi:MAG: orotate phosphoribosyltransferase [Bdellovibrionales bacterium]|nr:orotate phosphoribosyltransferase [Bdellovibrionales bacterium]